MKKGYLKKSAKSVIRFIIIVVIVVILDIAVNIFIDGMYILGVPDLDEIQAVSISYPAVTDEIKEVSGEDMELALKLTGFLRYDLLKKADDNEEPLITITYHLKNKTDKTISANNTTVWWNGKAHVIKDADMFVNLTEGIFFQEVYGDSGEDGSGIEPDTELDTESDIGPDAVAVNKITEPYKIKAYDNSNGEGGMSDFGENYQLIYYGMDTALSNLVTESEYKEWVKSFDLQSKDWNGCIQADFINFFGFDEEQVKNAIGMSYSEEQIKALISNDSKELDKAFVNPFAVYLNGKIYSPEWFAVHTWSDYQKEGITQDILSEYISKWNEERMIIPVLQTVYQLKQQGVEINMQEYNSISAYDDNIQLYGIPDTLRNTLPDDEYENYTAQFIGENVAAKRPLAEFNIVNFLTDNNVEYADFINMTKGILTAEEQKVIYSRNYEMIDGLFNNVAVVG